MRLIEAFNRSDMTGARELQAHAAAIIETSDWKRTFLSRPKTMLQSQGVPIQTPQTRRACFVKRRSKSSIRNFGWPIR